MPKTIIYPNNIKNNSVYPRMATKFKQLTAISAVLFPMIFCLFFPTVAEAQNKLNVEAKAVEDGSTIKKEASVLFLESVVNEFNDFSTIKQLHICSGMYQLIEKASKEVMLIRWKETLSEDVFQSEDSVFLKQIAFNVSLLDLEALLLGVDDATYKDSLKNATNWNQRWLFIAQSSRVGQKVFFDFRDLKCKPMVERSYEINKKNQDWLHMLKTDALHRYNNIVAKIKQG